MLYKIEPETNRYVGIVGIEGGSSQNDQEGSSKRNKPAPGVSPNVVDPFRR